jgi:hypothetical protein
MELKKEKKIKSRYGCLGFCIEVEKFLWSSSNPAQAPAAIKGSVAKIMKKQNPEVYYC